MEQKVGQNSLRDFTARLCRVPSSARCGRGEKNSLALRHLFTSFRPPLRASAAHTLTKVKSKIKLKTTNETCLPPCENLNALPTTAFGTKPTQKPGL